MAYSPAHWPRKVGSAARRDLCGGPRVTGVPTVTTSGYTGGFEIFTVERFRSIPLTGRRMSLKHFPYPLGFAASGLRDPTFRGGLPWTLLLTC
jgi:hypothetical protein